MLNKNTNKPFVIFISTVSTAPTATPVYDNILLKNEVPMKFSIDQKTLSQMLNHVSRAVADKSAITALEGIKFDIKEKNLTLTGYDLEIGIKTTFPVEADADFSFVLSSKLICQMIAKLPECTVYFEFTGGENSSVKITGEKIKTVIGAISADEYPNIPDYERDECFEVSGAILKNMVNMTRFAVATTEAKPILTGELFEIGDGVFNIAAIDGYRLALRTEKVATDKKYNFVIKLKSLSDVVALIREKKDDEDDTVKIYITKKSAAFEFDNFTIHTRLLEGEFHNYRRAIPTDDRVKTTVRVKTDALIRSLERCSLLIDDKLKNAVKFLINGDGIALSCKSPKGEYNDDISAVIDGPGLEIGFNANYVISALKSSETDEVYLKLIDGLSPMKVLPIDGDSFLFLVLPIRLY
jgi:DNA polymerase-3 subunit beta